ncbi:D-alanyl-D-alanine carboxypeptidase [Streptomyces sp. NBC_01190]|uniref:D-alanyl-D-alanine carboxypeptidase n=1 Tax=Streptomyces sp. NBC_01190 TaxID=2903767 RepID=UPI00386BE629|nr:D-alanyl-D-alanine carboxypeptidase [Streptomyces sp. NBC_01190]
MADAAETTNTADPSDTADAVVPAEAAESAAKRKSTPVAERDSWSEGDRESDVPAAGARAGKPVDEAVGASPAASGVAVPPTGSQALLEAPQAPGAPEADEEGPGGAAGAAANGDTDRGTDAVAVESAEAGPGGSIPDDAGAAESGPVEVASAVSGPAESAPEDGEPDPGDAAAPTPADRAAEATAAPAKRRVTPLVSDLPDRPAGEGEGPVVFGKPGRPVVARPSPYAPMRPAPVPLPKSAKPAAGQTGAQGAAATGTTGSQPATGAEGERVGPEGTRALPLPLPPAAEPAPLKLLAELTNTPPPPQTVLRTTVRRFKIWTPLVVLLAVVYVIVQAVRPLPAPDLALTADPVYTFEGTPLPRSMPWPAQGQSVAEVEGLGSLGVHGAQTPVPIASVTKVMTAYLILHDHPLSGRQTGPLITVDQQAANESSSADESTAAVKAGDKYTERQMLELLLIPSGNNIARLLSRWDAGTQAAFVRKMTAAAAELGMTHTTYTGASGFEETTVSTAEDQLKLARQVMKNDVFRSVVALPNINIPGVGMIYNNNNDLVHLGVVGIKTGSSTPAGGALMWAAHKTVAGRQQLILGVVLQQRGGSTVFDSLQVALKNSQKLIESVQGGLASATIVKKGQVVGEVRDGLGGATPVVAGKDLNAIGWPGMKADITIDANSSGVPHNAKAGSQVGTIGFGTGSARTTVPVLLQSNLSEPSFAKKLTWF